MCKYVGLIFISNKLENSNWNHIIVLYYITDGIEYWQLIAITQRIIIHADQVVHILKIMNEILQCSVHVYCLLS